MGKSDLPVAMAHVLKIGSNDQPLQTFSVGSEFGKSLTG